MHSKFCRDDTSSLFIGVTDEELVSLAAKKHPNAFSELLNRYTRLMLYRISCIKPVSDETEDYMQECSIALLDAVESYTPGKASFRTYASTCIDNRLRSVRRSANSEKNRPMSGYLEINDYLAQPDVCNEAAPLSDPEEQMMISESISELHQRLRARLSEREYKVFTMYLSGRSYDYIAASLGMTRKSVSNALQRVRAKLREDDTSDGEN